MAVIRTLPAAAVLLIALGGRVSAAVPNGFVDELVASGIPGGTAMAFAPDGRLFVCQQTGAVRVIKNGVLLATPFVTLSVNSAGERGVIGLAFDPAFAANRYVYIHYTTSASPIHNRVSRFTASGDVALPGSEVALIDMNPLSSATNHNGGGLAFRADGTLLIAVGENATPSNAQSLSNLLGKILRINSNGTIPTDNPLYSTATGINRAIWAYGLRNPFTFGIQPSTDRVFLNDVGQGTWEEIDDGIAGANYGWPLSEGSTSTIGQTGPLYSYGHGTGPFLGCAIAGGAFYEAPIAPFPSTYAHDYFFADLCGGWINRRRSATGAVTTFASGVSGPVDLDVSASGALYYLARNAGTVRRIRYVPAVVKSLVKTAPAMPVTGTSVSWSASATGGGTVEYRFLVFDPGTQAWTGTAYSTSPTFSFTPSVAGNYIVQAWARNVGSPDAYEGYASSGLVAVASGAITIGSLASDQVLPLASGVPATWTTTLNGGTGPFEYRYWLFTGATHSWTIARDYGTTAAWTWTPPGTGTFAVRVWARTVGAPTAFEAARETPVFSVAAGVPATPALVASLSLPVVAGTPVTWTASTTGGRQATQYEFWVYQQATSTWRLARGWSAQPTWTWRPTLAGGYIVQVWVRAAGSTAMYQAWQSSGVVSVLPAPVTALAVEADRSQPFAPGTQVQWTAVAAGDSVPLEYQFWGSDGATWSMIRDYAPAETVTWAVGPGPRAVEARVRHIGSSATFESLAHTPTFQVGPSPVAVQLKSNQVFPLAARTPSTWTATATGGSAPLEFRFLLHDGQSWTIVEDWSSARTWSWTPASGDAGRYTLQVWARSAGQATYEAWTGTTFSIAP